MLEAVCPDCKALNSIVTNPVEGSRVCTSCGTVQATHLVDETCEWRNFGAEGSGADMNRVGAAFNSNLENGGLSLQISGGSNTKLARVSQKLSGSAKDKNKMKAWASIREI